MTPPFLTVLLVLELCETEEQSRGPEIARVRRKESEDGPLYAACVVDRWEEMLINLQPERADYIRELVHFLKSADQHELHELFCAGAEMSTGPVRGRISKAARSQKQS